MQLYQGFGYGQAKTGPRRCPGGRVVYPIEFLEQLVTVFTADSRSVIPHVYPQEFRSLFVGINIDLYRRFRRTVLHCVTQQIG